MREMTTHDSENNVVKIGDMVAFNLRNSPKNRESYDLHIKKVVSIHFDSYYGYVPRVDIDEEIDGETYKMVVLPQYLKKVELPYPDSVNLKPMLPYNIFLEEMKTKPWNKGKSIYNL